MLADDDKPCSSVKRYCCCFCDAFLCYCCCYVFDPCLINDLTMFIFSFFKKKRSQLFSNYRKFISFFFITFYKKHASFFGLIVYFVFLENGPKHRVLYFKEKFGKVYKRYLRFTPSFERQLFHSRRDKRSSLSTSQNLPKARPQRLGLTAYV